MSDRRAAGHARSRVPHAAIAASFYSTTFNHMPIIIRKWQTYQVWMACKCIHTNDGKQRDRKPPNRVIPWAVRSDSVVFLPSHIQAPPTAICNETDPEKSWFQCIIHYWYSRAVQMWVSSPSTAPRPEGAIPSLGAFLDRLTLDQVNS
jgi:hypothetical protein